MLHTARRLTSGHVVLRSYIQTSSPAVSHSIHRSSSLLSLHQRNFTETSEERAKRMSDEADAEFRASGKKAKLRTQRPPVAEPTAEDTSSQSSSTSADSTTQSTPETAETSQSSTSSSKSSSRTSHTSWFTTLTNEVHNLKQFMNKYSKKTKEKTKRDVAAVLSNENPYMPAEKSPLDEVKDEMKEEETLDSETEYKGPSELVLVDSSTVWDKRLERMRDSLGASAPLIKFRKFKRVLVHSKNPILKPFHVVNEAVDDFKLTWETSQHPALFKVRNITDKVMGENEQGFALGEILKVDPSFDLLDFIDEMEHYMIPAVVTAYLRGSPRDAKMLKGCSEGAAATAFWASLRARDAAKVQWDSTILDLSGVELQNALMVKDQPYLLVSFVVQQVKCVRKLKGYDEAAHKLSQEASKKQAGAAAAAATPVVKSSDPDVVEGDPSQIVSMYYHFLLRRDFENPDFDWKIVEFASQEMFHLSA